MRHILPLLLLTGFVATAQQTNAPRHYMRVAGPLTAASSALPEEIARQYLRSVAQDLSLTSQDLNSIYVAKEYRTAQNGVTHIVFRQRFRDIDVANAEWVVNMDRDGQVLNAGGQLLPAPKTSRAVPVRTRALTAVRSAVAAVNPALKDLYAPFESMEPAKLRNGIRFSRGAMPRDIEGATVWYAHRGELRPAWEFVVDDTDRVHRYSVMVDDESQGVLGKHALTFFQAADTAPAVPRGMVFDKESPQPSSTPGVRLTTPPAVVPRVMMSFKGDPTASPLGWTDGKSTAGNNVIAGENLAGTGFIRPTPTQSTSGEFNFPLALGAGYLPLAYGDAAVTNLFYWVNRAHDLHYQYGFDEQAGNFQADNFGRGGTGGDPLYAYAHYGAQALGSGQIENAFFSLTGGSDGDQPEISMFISSGAGATNDVFTDGSYDSIVMIHEYTHGVSNRLARQVYSTFQGAAMGEAWSDFYSLEYTLPDGAPPDGIYPAGEYFTQSWGYGIRERPYSTKMEIDPITYGNIGHVWTAPEVHADGEIWMEALWELRANLITQFGETEGRKRVRQLVIDGMKLAVPQATMVDMRDAILLADRVDFKGASQAQLWAGFAKRGLGALAWSDGGTTVHVMSSTDLPSNKGQMKFYDDPIVIGETLRIVLQDSNIDAPSVRIQLTGSSGDLEDLTLFRQGSIYVGRIGTTYGSVTQRNRRLELASTDQVSAYYYDADTGSGGKLIQITIATQNPYAISSSAPAFTFARESRVSVPSGSFLSYNLPFVFPFFSQEYGTAYVYPNGLIAFERPLLPSSCADFITLQSVSGIAPLWTASSATSLSGSAQPSEGLYISTGPDSVTFRWAGEYTAVGQAPSPTAYAATLYSDGRVQFNYGPTQNQTVMTPSTFSECAAPTAGIANGHGVYSSSVGFATFQNEATISFNPPLHTPSLPTAAITTPKAGDHVQDILTVSGTATDSATFVTFVDVLIDGVNRAHVTTSGASGAWTSTLNIGALGITGGDHKLAIRVTNARGGFANLPATPITFTVDPGTAFAPVVAIERPLDGATITGPLSLRGYAYGTTLRVSSVDTLIDGFVYAGTSYGASRTDICTGLSPAPPNCPNVGFTGLFETLEAFPPIPDGPHTLQVRVRDQTGRFTLYPATPLKITVKNGAAAQIVGVLEAPKSGAVLSGTVTVSGYVYSPGQKITRAVLMVDSVLKTAVTIGVSRPDVCASLPAADACPAIGFTFQYDTRQLLNGPHALGIYAENDRGDYVAFPLIQNGGINVFVQN
jgi:hypothetical protein